MQEKEKPDMEKPETDFVLAASFQTSFQTSFAHVFPVCLQFGVDDHTMVHVHVILDPVLTSVVGLIVKLVQGTTSKQAKNANWTPKPKYSQVMEWLLTPGQTTRDTGLTPGCQGA